MSDHSQLIEDAYELASLLTRDHVTPDRLVGDCVTMIRRLSMALETYHSHYADILDTYAPVIGGVEGSREASFGEQREAHSA